MSDQLSPNDPYPQSYHRPTRRWLCGYASEGLECPFGPDATGRCRTAGECAPVLELKAGELKGRHRCTRAKERGGSCETGPMPDGTCGRPIARCQPVRSLRARRGVLSAAVLAATLGALLIALDGSWRFQAVNPGELSAPHAGSAFARRGGATNDNECSACHDAASRSAVGWASVALSTGPAPWDVRGLTHHGALPMTALDANCVRCHPGRDFHQATVDLAPSCSACHREHRGNGALLAPDDRHCAACHGDAATMEAAAQKGLTTPPADFAAHFQSEANLFPSPRPELGYTRVFRSFAVDHPNFRVLADQRRETNTLRFNHARHFADDIPLLHGRKLECAFCHQPDASGVFHASPTFALNCRPCHGLQFDPRNPAMELPHGDVALARAFLRSLPDQYADHARREKKIANQREVDADVARQLAALREEVRSIPNLENKIFFSTRRWAPGEVAGNAASAGKPLFQGCALCHEVQHDATLGARVTPPFIPKRWLSHGAFDHAKHATMDCRGCHDAATRSRETADILLPRQDICARCHSPQGGAAFNCSSCHSYHRPQHRSEGK